MGWQAKLQCAHSGAKEWTATVSEGLAFVEEGYSPPFEMSKDPCNSAMPNNGQNLWQGTFRLALASCRTRGAALLGGQPLSHAAGGSTQRLAAAVFSKTLGKDATRDAQGACFDAMAFWGMEMAGGSGACFETLGLESQKSSRGR